MACRQFTSLNTTILGAPSNFSSGFARFYSKSSPYLVKVGIPEFLKGVGKGVETHVQKLENEIGEFQKLLVTRTLKLKKLEIPCKHVLPSLMDKFFSREMEPLLKVYCGEDVWPLAYYNRSKNIDGFGPIIKIFKVKLHDSMFFTMTNANEAMMRIFKKDGTGVVYDQTGRRPRIDGDHWYMNNNWDYTNLVDDDTIAGPSNVKIEVDDDVVYNVYNNVGDQHEDTNFEFVELLTASNVDGTSHGVRKLILKYAHKYRQGLWRPRAEPVKKA